MKYRSTRVSEVLFRSELTREDAFCSVLLEQPHTLVCGCSCFTAFFIFHFRQPNLGRLLTDLAEIWHADRKLM